jgi:hypothetical protein
MMNGFAHSCVLAGAIERITLCGNVTEFSIPTHNSRPIAIVPEPGGEAMWFTEEAGNKVGRKNQVRRLADVSIWFQPCEAAFRRFSDCQHCGQQPRIRPDS